MAAAPILPVMLSWRDLVVGYDGEAVVRMPDGVVAAGQGVVVRGPNGGGKSTLLRTLAGALVPVAGQVQAPAATAWVPQIGGLRPDLPTTLGELVALAGPPAPALTALGLGDRAHQRWAASSGGERQRALIARALAARPDLLLLDEPDSHLDDDGCRLLEQALADLCARGGTWIAVLHGTTAARVDLTWTCQEGAVAPWT